MNEPAHAQGQKGPLRGCPVALVERYDVGLFDLDGVVYIGRDAVPGAATALEKARAAGLRLAFVTNNASRAPQTVANHLVELGITASPEEVVTSAQAAGRVLAERLPVGATVLVVGAPALAAEVSARGMRVVRVADERPMAVVQGYAADTSWRDLAEATAAIHAGALWVATNRDATLPSPRGPMPGNGALVSAVRMAVGIDPLVTGKPEPALHEESIDRTGARAPLVVGDRLDTDIEGACRVGCDSLLVLTGLTTPADLLTAAPLRRPTYLAADLEGLLVPHPEPFVDTDGAYLCGGWRVGSGSADRPLELQGDGEDVDALRALCAAAWAEPHAGPASDRAMPPSVRAGGPSARAVLDRLAL